MAELTLTDQGLSDALLKRALFCPKCDNELDYVTHFPPQAAVLTWAMGCKRCDRHAYVSVTHPELVQASDRKAALVLVYKRLSEAFDKLDDDHPLRVRKREAEW